MSEKTLYTWLIYFILPALYASSRSLWEPLTELYESSHPLWLFHGIHCVQDTQVPVMTTHNTELAHRPLSGVLKLGLHGQHGSGEGDVAQPQPIHWPVNDFNEEFTHSQGETRWSTILLKWQLLHNLTVAWLWYNIIPHLMPLAPLTVLSKKYGPMIYR